jgi:hypothetical protein
MASLNAHWLTEGWIDFEFKKYQLLAYLQDTAAHFDEKKLYPSLSELIEHYRNLKSFKEKKGMMSELFPKEISRLDLEGRRIEYQPLMEDDALIKELDEIIDFALPVMESRLDDGKGLYEEVAQQLQVFPVGIVPLRTQEGYFFLSDCLSRHVSVYLYQVTLFESASEKFRALQASHITDYEISLTHNYESIRYDLITGQRTLPNPATYVVEFKVSYPLPETMLPVAKRSLIRALSV